MYKKYNNHAGIAGNTSRKQRLRDSYLVMQDVNHQLFFESVEGELLLSDPNLTKDQIAAYLADLDLLEFAEDHPMALSGGQKQRAAVAAACAAKKNIYILMNLQVDLITYRCET